MPSRVQVEIVLDGEVHLTVACGEPDPGSARSFREPRDLLEAEASHVEGPRALFLACRIEDLGVVK